MSDPYLDAVLTTSASLPAGDAITDPVLARSVAAQMVRPDTYAEPDVPVRADAAPGPHGPVPVRVYGEAASEGPVLVWCHGGGWIGGDLDMGEADGTARETVARTGGVVVSVDYRLCLGVHYPVPLDDVEAAYRWAVQQWPANRVSLGGASAGANLAAGLCVRLRDNDHPLPASLVLAYPLVHPVLPPMSAELQQKTAPLSALLAFGPELLTALVENYLGGPLAEAPGEAMPGLAPADGLPRTLLVNDEHDALRASGEAYAAQLEAAGVTVELACEPGVVHGHLNQVWSDQAQSTLDRMAEWLRQS